MSFLNGQSVRKLLLPFSFEEAQQKCETDQIEALGDGIGIYPFREGSLSCMSYDLTVGGEAYSLRKARKVKIDRDSPLSIDPGETVLILTHEYLVLSARYAALCVSRARIMNEGVSQTSAKVDPTWFGKLIVPLTNNTKRVLVLTHLQPFCALLFLRLDDAVARISFLNRKELPFLGQTTLEYSPTHATVWQPLSPDKVKDADVDDMVELFGSPFDVLRGAIHQGRERIIKYMEEQWSPSALRDIKYSLWEQEIDALKKGRDKELRFIKSIFASMVVAVLLAVLGWIGAIVYLVARSR
jgi:deoxycytidine triphosphate deaminase